MTDKTKLYELPGTGIELSEEQLLALTNLVHEPGWRVLMQMKQIEKAAAIDGGMALNAPEEQRTMNRAVYHKILADEMLPDMIRDTLEIVAQQKHLK